MTNLHRIIDDTEDANYAKLVARTEFSLALHEYDRAHLVPGTALHRWYADTEPSTRSERIAREFGEPVSIYLETT